MRRHPGPRAEIPVSAEVYNQLLGASVKSGFQKECWEIAEAAIDEWARRHNPDDIPMPATRGYQWKSLFLPDGTLLRTVFGGKNHHCRVENDGILYNGKAVSPSGFVNAVGGIRRNAWRCTWILLPQDKEWKLADSLRSRQRLRRERKTTRVSPQAIVGHACATDAPANVSPEARPTPEPAVPAAENASAEPRAQSSRLDQVQLTDSHTERHGGQRCSGTSLFFPQCRRGAERRLSRDDRLPSLLREELRHLLDRMCAVDNERRQARL